MIVIDLDSAVTIAVGAMALAIVATIVVVVIVSVYRAVSQGRRDDGWRRDRVRARKKAENRARWKWWRRMRRRWRGDRP